MNGSIHVTDLVSGEEIPREHDDDLRQLATKIQGFLYLSNTLTTIVRTVEVLRANPELAKRLLGPP
jgi:hypothetical protein